VKNLQGEHVVWYLLGSGNELRGQEYYCVGFDAVYGGSHWKTFQLFRKSELGELRGIAFSADQEVAVEGNIIQGSKTPYSLVSRRLRDVILDIQPGFGEYVPITVGGVPWWAMKSNVHIADAYIPERSEIKVAGIKGRERGIRRVEFREEKVAGLDFFSLEGPKYMCYPIYCSERAKAMIEAAGFEDVGFVVSNSKDPLDTNFLNSYDAI